MLVPSNPEAFIPAVKESKFEDCNLTRADEFFKKYPPENVEESMKFQRNARQLLARAKQYLDDLGIPFWLSSGTCLGKITPMVEDFISFGYFFYYQFLMNLNL